MLSYDTITTSTPEKSLLKKYKKTGGRNDRGKMTIQHVGGGHKRRYRLVDFKREKFGVPARVATIEYDPNRTANIALLHYADGEKRYIIAPHGLTVGTEVVSCKGSPIEIGNALPLSEIPLGTIIHNLERSEEHTSELQSQASLVCRLLLAKTKTFFLLKT